VALMKVSLARVVTSRAYAAYLRIRRVTKSRRIRLSDVQI
jgi:hypothetical protein